MSELFIGVVSGVISSIIVLFMTSISKYIFRMRTEKCKLYNLKYIGARDACAPPEYPRETEYAMPEGSEECENEEFYEKVDIVKLQFPFDIKEIEIYTNDQLIYPTDNIKHLPAGESIYVNCKLLIGSDVPAFVVRCKTFRHEYREYEYTTIYKYSGGMSGFGLKLIKQRFCI